MSAPVPFDEAVQILHWIGQAPGNVRAVRDVDAGAYGPLPFIVDWQGEEALVVLQITGGVITSVDFIKVGARFSNAHDWIGEADGGPLDALPELMVELLALSVASAGERA